MIRRHKCFKFKESKTEPYIHLKITVPEDERYYTIGMDPIPAEVSYTISAGVGSMGALTGTLMKFLSGIHTCTHILTVTCFPE